MNRWPVALGALALVAISATGCNRPATPSSNTIPDSSAAFDVAAMRPVIEARNRAFTQAHVVSDSAGMVNIFTSDARVLPPNAEPVIGKRAIEILTAQYLTYGITEFREETTAFYGNQDMLIDEGTYVMVYDKGKTTEKGKYVNIWRQENGEWKIYSNMWNSSTPVVSGK